MDFVIDIVGTCNLSCPSCPVGNMGDVDRPTGLMELGLFRDIVKKIIDETPDPTAIHLYNWGEPFLDKELPELIKVVKESGLACALSTNLTTLDPNLRAVLKAKPDGILVSL
jgi:MoaA/NifB/PqqE/SkfB family radical SAM enzyme